MQSLKNVITCTGYSIGRMLITVGLITVEQLIQRSDNMQ